MATPDKIAAHRAAMEEEDLNSSDDQWRLIRGILVVTMMGEASVHAAHTDYRTGLKTALGRRGIHVSDDRMLLRALWQLVSGGYMYVDFTHGFAQPTNWINSPQNWIWQLTNRGIRLAQAKINEIEPDDEQGYLRLLRANVPDIDDQVMLYISEALRAYHGEAYLASTVMLGVASERAFQRLGEAFLKWLPQREADVFAETFGNPKRNYINKFEEFRKRLEPKKGEIPAEFTDNMALNLDAVADMLRVNRNEAGHPTGRTFGESEAYINLQTFARYIVKLYGLRDFFLAPR